MEREEEIRLIAYRIWEEEGRPQALDFEHWLKAEAMWREHHGQERSGDLPESPAQQLGVKGKQTRSGPERSTSKGRKGSARDGREQ